MRIQPIAQLIDETDNLLTRYVQPLLSHFHGLRTVGTFSGVECDERNAEHFGAQTHLWSLRRRTQESEREDSSVPSTGRQLSERTTWTDEPDHQFYRA